MTPTARSNMCTDCRYLVRRVGFNKTMIHEYNYYTITTVSRVKFAKSRAANQKDWLWPASQQTRNQFRTR